MLTYAKNVTCKLFDIESVSMKEILLNMLKVSKFFLSFVFIRTPNIWVRKIFRFYFEIGKKIMLFIFEYFIL